MYASFRINSFSHYNYCPVSWSYYYYSILQMRKLTVSKVKQLFSGTELVSGKDGLSDLKQIYKQSRRQSQERFKNQG